MVVQVGTCPSQHPVLCLVHNWPSINTCKVKKDTVMGPTHLLGRVLTSAAGSLAPARGASPHSPPTAAISFLHAPYGSLTAEQLTCSASGHFSLLPNASLLLLSDFSILREKQPSGSFWLDLSEALSISPQLSRLVSHPETHSPADQQKNPETRVVFLNTPS